MDTAEIRRRFLDGEGMALNLDQLRAGQQFVLALEGRAETGQSHLAVLSQGLPAGFNPGSGLGLQIVRALVEGELRGWITWDPAPGGGTQVVVHAQLRSLDRGSDRAALVPLLPGGTP